MADGTDRAALERQAAELEADLLTESYEPEVTGAPMKVRFLVGLAKGPQSQLATLQKYQKDQGIEPDAEFVTRRAPHDTGGHQGGPGEKPDPYRYHTSLMYTDPETGKRTLVNPPGVDLGDFAGHSRDLARMVAYGLAAGGTAMTPAAAGAPAVGVGASQLTDEAIDRWIGPALGVVDTREESDKLIDRGADLGMEAGLMFGTSAVGKVGNSLVEAATSGKGGLGPAGARLRIPGSAGSGDAATVRAAADLGIERVPSAFASSSGTVHRLTDAALKNPHTNQVLQPEYDEFMRRVRGAMESELATGAPAGQVGKQGMGKELKTTLSTWKDQQGVAIDRIENTMEHLMDAKPVDVTDAVAFYNNEAQRFGTGGRFPPEFKAMVKQAEQNGGLVAWDVAKRARTAIGRQLEKDDPAVIEALSPAYKVMTEARSKAAMEAKGQMPELWRTSQALEKRVATEWEEVRNLTQQPQVEQAFNLLAGSTKQGPSMMEAVKAKVPTQTFDRLVATMARDAALVTRDQSRNVMTAGGKQLDAVMSPAAYNKWYRDLKKSGTLDVAAPPGSGLRKSLDNFAEIGASLERSSAGMTFSNSPSGMRYTEMLEGRQGGDAGAAIGEAGSALQSGRGMEALKKAANYGLDKTFDAYAALHARAQAKLLADPEFTKWMLESKALKPRDPAGWNAHVSRLAGIATSKPDLRGDIIDYVHNLDAQEAESPQEMADQMAQSADVRNKLNVKSKGGVRVKEKPGG